MWQTTTTTFATYVSANFANYKVALTAAGTAATSPFYQANMPSGITAAGLYGFAVFAQVGGTAAESDTQVAGGVIDWDGSATSYLNTRAPSSTALSTANWTNARAGYQDNLSGGAVALAANWTATRAGYLDNLSAGAPALASVWTPTKAGYLTGDAFVRLGTPAGASTAADIAAVYARTDVATSTRLQPTVTGRTLDVSAGGEAGVDWANVGGTTTAVNLVNTQVGAVVNVNTVATLAGLQDFNGNTYPFAAALDGTMYHLETTLTGSGIASSVWANGTRTLTSGANIVLAKGTGITGFNDIAATAVVSGGAITTSGGAVSTVTTLTNLPAIPANWLTAAGVAASALNGKGDWLTTSGYTAPNNAGIASIVAKLPVNNIADETLVLAAVGSPQQAGSAVTLPANPPAGFIVSASFAAGATLPRVTLVDTTTTNTDMRGTNNALLASSYVAPDNTNIGYLGGLLNAGHTAFTATALANAPTTTVPPYPTPLATDAIADRMLGRNIAGGADGGRTVGQALAAARNKVAFDVPAAGQFTVFAADDATPLWTGTYARGGTGLGPLTLTDPA